VRAVRLRALGVSTARRSTLAPELPTIAESRVAALATFDAGSQFGLFVPAGTPRALQARMHVDIDASLAALREEILATGVEPRQMTQAGFAAYLQQQLDVWGPVIKARNIRAE
jgi:tripartite-type tricarboxylate transporter receptor subunit TctC